MTPAAVSTSIHRMRQPALRGDALDQVAVGGEVVGVDDDLGPRGVARAAARRPRPGPACRAARSSSRRSRVCPGAGSQRDPAELVAEGQRLLEPLLVPAPDQPPAPLLAHEPSPAWSASPPADGPASCRRSRPAVCRRRRTARGSDASGSAASSQRPGRGRGQSGVASRGLHVYRMPHCRIVRREGSSPVAGSRCFTRRTISLVADEPHRRADPADPAGRHQPAVLVVEQLEARG